MTDNGAPYYREYRLSQNWRWLAAGVTVPLFGALWLVLDLARDEEVPGLVTFCVGLGFVGLFVFLVALVRASATIADEKHLTVRSLFGTRAVPWPRVQGIEIEANPGADTQVAVLYDESGKRYPLPHLHDRAHANLSVEVAELRAAWTRRRGADWVQLPEVAAKIERIRRHPTPLALVALIGAPVGFAAGVLIFLVALPNGVYEYNADNSALVDLITHPVTLMAGLPVLGVGVALWIGIARRRRDA